MPKYEIGDLVVSAISGRTFRITKIHSTGGKPYSAQLLNGTKQYGFNEEEIAGRLGEVDPNALKDAAPAGFAFAQGLAMKQAEKCEGTPEGDRWLLLATLKIGDSVQVGKFGVPKPYIFRGFRLDKKGTKFLAQPFLADGPQGGRYRWDLSDLYIKGSKIENPGGGLTITNPPDPVKQGTLGQLLLLCQRHLDEGVSPETKVYLASDEEGNSYNTLYNLQIERGKRGKVIVVNVNHDNLMCEDVFA